MARTAKPPPLTVAEAAVRLGVNRSHVYEWIHSGLIASIRYPSRTGAPGGPLRIEEAEVDRFLARHRQAAAS